MDVGAQQARCGIHSLASRLRDAYLQIPVAVDAVVKLPPVAQRFSILEGETHSAAPNHRYKGAVPMPIFQPVAVCVGDELPKVVDVLYVNNGRLRIFYFRVGDLKLFEVCFRWP